MKSPQSKNIVTQFQAIVKAFFFSDFPFLKGFFEFSFILRVIKIIKSLTKTNKKI